MAMCRRFCFPTNSIKTYLNFSTSGCVSNKWRRQQGLEPEPRQFGPLTNLPDYSFVDGRPVLLSYRKLMKIEYQKNICKRIVELSNELDMGLQQFNEEEDRKRKAKQAILNSKLKEKGAKLLQQNKSSNSEP